MDFNISPEAKEIKKTIRRFVDREIEPLSRQIEQDGIIPNHLIEGMRELGLFGLVIPPRYGGLGLSILDQCLVYEELCRANGCIRTYIGTNNGPAIECLLTSGSEALKEKFLPPAARGDLIAAFAVSEPDSGSNLAGINATAKRHGDRYILNGAKFYITMGDLADFVVVLAYTDKSLGSKRGMSAFVVEKGSKGFSVGTIDQKMGLRGSNTCELVFDQCEVPAANLVGEEGRGFDVVLGAITRGRVTIGAVALGAAGKLLDMAVEYSRQRQVGGEPLGNLQAIQIKLADMATELQASRLMVYHAAWLGDQGRSMIKEASMAKLFATEMVNRAAYQTLQIFGGMGYMKETQVERIARDVRVLTIYEGTSEIQRVTIGRKLLQKA